MGSKYICKRMILDVFVVSKRISLIGCTFLNACCKLLGLKIQSLGTLKTFPRDPTNSHVKDKVSFLVGQLKKTLAR